jgi:thiosulfate reductase cytochrome b subunit
MNASTERKIMRWIHIILSFPIVGYIYEPVADKPNAAFATQFVFVPTVILSGLWMWKGQDVRKWLKRLGNKQR